MQMKGFTKSALALAVTAAGTLAFTHLTSPLRVQPSSTLTVAGTSTVRSYECRAKVIDATIEGTTPEAVSHVLAGEKGVTTAELRVPVELMDCGNGTMNEHMRKALKAKDNPIIDFKVASYELVKGDAGARVRMNGALSISGTTKQVVIEADAKPGPAGALAVAGSYTLNMSDFGVKPPTLMLGTLKVADKVDVKFELLLKP